MGLPDITYVDVYVNDGQRSVLSLKNFYETILVSSVDNPDHIYRIPINDFFIRYKDQLVDSVQYYNVPESMFYKPKMLSLELYETTEIWLGLLRLNDMRNTSEFYQPIIKVYNPDMLKEFINIFFKREGKNI